MSAERGFALEKGSSVPWRTRADLESVVIWSAREGANRGLSTSYTSRRVADMVDRVIGDHRTGDKRKTYFKLQDQQEIVRRVIASYARNRGEESPWLSKAFEALASDRYATMEIPDQTRIAMREDVFTVRGELSPVLDVASIFNQQELLSLAPGEGYFGIFELIDAKGKPVFESASDSKSLKNVYFEFGRSNAGDLVANHINSSGFILESLDEASFKEAVLKRGGAKLRKLSGAHSYMFDVSASAGKK